MIQGFICIVLHHQAPTICQRIWWPLKFRFNWVKHNLVKGNQRSLELTTDSVYRGKEPANQPASMRKQIERSQFCRWFDATFIDKRDLTHVIA